jgi:hypothetical protein
VSRRAVRPTGYLVQAGHLRVALLDAAQQVPVERQGGVAAAVAYLPVHGRLAVPPADAVSPAQHLFFR